MALEHRRFEGSTVRGFDDFNASATKRLRTRNYLFSWSYWFSSRTLGLLSHPYVTMREIVRERFLRPLIILPVVVWLMSWVVAILLGRIGLWFGFQHVWWSVPVGKGLVFVWLWGTVFLVMWQIVLGYLYVRFRGLGKGF